MRIRKKLDIKSLLHYSLLALLFACVQGSASAQVSGDPAPSVVVHASIDTAEITMGSRTMLRVEVVKNGHQGVLAGMPKQEPGKVMSYAGAEVRSVTMDSTELGNNRVQVNYNFVLQPFEPGVLTFPQFKYATPGNDTAYSETVTLKVIEPNMPKEMRDSLWINPMAGTVSIKARWYDFIPSYWPWILIGIAVIAIIVAVIMLYKKNGPGLLPRKKVVPPYDLAHARLMKLKSQKLAETGHVKEYYTELTDILRQYLEGRFGIYAREMTSTQIIEAMTTNAETNKYVDEMREMLATADFVKFAKQQPLPDDNIRSFAVVNDFVQATKPVEDEESDTQAGKRKSKRRKSNKGKKKK